MDNLDNSLQVPDKELRFVRLLSYYAVSVYFQALVSLVFLDSFIDQVLV